MVFTKGDENEKNRGIIVTLYSLSVSEDFDFWTF